MIHILWDASHIWGILLMKAARVLGVPHRLVKATEIAQGEISCKGHSIGKGRNSPDSSLIRADEGPPSMLLVPGGSARLKARALGRAGREAIRAYVAGGGHYLGFCGGAGLGLSEAEADQNPAEQGAGSLGLCPWRRAPYQNRLQHLMSGHVQIVPARHRLAPPGGSSGVSLPVWWPGRFEPGEGGVLVLASYEQPQNDFWLVDLPLADLPSGIIAEWEALYGFAPRPDFLAGQPCMVHGKFGLGSYTLSYAHLETPGSPEANAWLAHLLRELGGEKFIDSVIPPWDIFNQEVAWPHEPLTAPLLEARKNMEEVWLIGRRHNLLFKRAGWLLGWRTGLPGAAINNFRAALCTAPSLPLNEKGRALLAEHHDFLTHMLPVFGHAAKSYLMAERLAGALMPFLPDFMDKKALKMQSEALFGRPMQGGGLCGELLNVLDELIFALGAVYR